MEHLASRALGDPLLREAVGRAQSRCTSSNRGAARASWLLLWAVLDLGCPPGVGSGEA